MNITKKLERIQEALYNLLEHESECRICPRECGKNREKGEKGFCQSVNQATLSHAILHFGEEPVLSGSCYQSGDETNNTQHPKGSGTLFFSGCNLKCVFCQNYQLSWHNKGKRISHNELATKMLSLQKQGALNINLVSPTHIIIPILRALKIAYSQGLKLPLLYNSNGYEKLETVKELDGIIDIYLPDLKYFSPKISEKLSGVEDYFFHASQVIEEMYRQQPSLFLDDLGIARKGLIIRHLALPGLTDESIAIIEWISGYISTSVTLSLMSQYHPCFKAPPEVQRHLSLQEYQKVISRAQELSFENMFIQPESFAPEEHLIPDFDKTNPFHWK